MPLPVSCNTPKYRSNSGSSGSSFDLESGHFSQHEFVRHRFYHHSFVRGAVYLLCPWRRRSRLRNKWRLFAEQPARSRPGIAQIVQALRGVRGPRQRDAGAELALLRWADISSRRHLGLCCADARAVRLLLPKPGCCSRQCRAVAIRGCSVRTAAAGGFHRGA